jgi:hypothetical protein
MGGEVMSPASGGSQRKDRKRTDMGPALDLVEEYAKKLKDGAEELQQLNMKYLEEALQFQLLKEQRPSGSLPSESHRIHEKRLVLLRETYSSKRAALQSLLPAAKQLSQYLSQTVEHALTEPLDKVILSLRLADLEAALRYAQHTAPGLAV